MNLKRNLHWIIYILFFSCAKQSSPTGGPKDTIPPVLVEAIPANEATNFKGKSLQLIFNEMIIANNPKEQIIITPTIGKDFDVKTRKNSLILNFDNPLEDSTTYTFNFREAVQDITEKNPARNLQIAISTGAYLDSLSIEGTIYDLQTGKEIKDATVAIHTQNDTFSILKHPAIFFTKTNEKGRFKIDHLKPDIYYLYAMQDKNRNLFADSRTESYGFRAEPIHLTTDTSQLSLELIKLDTRPLKITSTRPFNTFFNIRTSKNLKTFQLSAEDSTEIFYNFGEDQSNIRIYNTLAQRDSMAVHLTAIDSIENKIDTTLYAKFLDREITPEKFNVSISSSSIVADRGLLKATITFNKPVKTINFDSLFFQADSLNKINFTEENLTWDKQHSKLTVTKQMDKKLFAPKPETENQTPQKPAQEKAAPTQKSTPPSQGTPEKQAPKQIVSNQLYAGHAAFISIENDSSRKFTETITPLKTEDLSIIMYDIRTVHKNIIIQLVNKELNVLREFNNKPKGQFEDLSPGEYMVRVIIDRNANKIWDPGNYLLKQEPEPIIYYIGEKGAKSINLKTNWEYELAPMLINL